MVLETIHCIVFRLIYVTKVVIFNNKEKNLNKKTP